MFNERFPQRPFLTKSRQTQSSYRVGLLYVCAVSCVIYTHAIYILVFGASSVLYVAGVWLLALFPGIYLCHYLAMGNGSLCNCGCGYIWVGIVSDSPVPPL